MGVKLNLESYFDDWIIVDVAGDSVEDAKVWCDSNIGRCGLNWMHYVKTTQKSKFNFMSHTTSFLFKNSVDATLFVLMWGGSPINK